jgi:hypothetical protein
VTADWVFILKTLFPQKLSISFTNPTSTGGLQLLNLWCLNSGVMTIKPGYQTTGNKCDMVRWVVFHAVPYMRKGLHLENPQGSLQSGMSGSKRGTWRRFYEGLGSNIMVQYSVGFIIIFHGWITAREYMERLGNQMHPLIQMLFTNSDSVSKKKTVPPFT